MSGNEQQNPLDAGELQRVLAARSEPGHLQPITDSVQAALAPSSNDDYPAPYRSAAKDSLNDPWGGFPNRECTSFVAWRMHRDGFSLSGINGNAGVWDASAASHNVVVDGTPSVGAVAQFHGGEGGAFSAGHVAYVAQINSDGSVWIEDYNWNPANYLLHLLTKGAPRYIHVEPITEELMTLSQKRAFVRLAYLAGLGREPESQAAEDGWANQIHDNGDNTDAIMAAIGDSAEAQRWRTKLRSVLGM